MDKLKRCLLEYGVCSKLSTASDTDLEWERFQIKKGICQDHLKSGLHNRECIDSSGTYLCFL